MLLAPRPVPQVKRWQLQMSPLIRLVQRTMPYRPSIGPAAPLMPMLPWPKNDIGNTNTCLNWEKTSLRPAVAVINPPINSLPAHLPAPGSPRMG